MRYQNESEKDFSGTRLTQVMQGASAEARDFMREAIQFEPHIGDLLDMIVTLTDQVRTAGDLEIVDADGDSVADQITEAAQVLYMLEQVSDKNGPTVQQLFDLIQRTPSQVEVAVDVSGEKPHVTIDMTLTDGTSPYGPITFFDDK